MIANRDSGHLVIIDMQEKLASAMPQETFHVVAKNCGILLQAASLLEIPVTYTEQYPKGLGTTIPELLPFLSSSSPVEKTAFSCADEPRFCQQLATDRPQIILAGMEAHICVLQTALQLQQLGRQVYVAEDAIISRNPANKANALDRLRQAGIVISNTESIVFEWLGKAEGDAFKQISKLVR